MALRSPMSTQASLSGTQFGRASGHPIRIGPCSRASVDSLHRASALGAAGHPVFGRDLRLLRSQRPLGGARANPARVSCLRRDAGASRGILLCGLLHAFRLTARALGGSWQSPHADHARPCDLERDDRMLRGRPELLAIGSLPDRGWCRTIRRYSRGSVAHCGLLPTSATCKRARNIHGVIDGWVPTWVPGRRLDRGSARMARCFPCWWGDGSRVSARHATRTLGTQELPHSGCWPSTRKCAPSTAAIGQEEILSFCPCGRLCVLPFCFWRTALYPRFPDANSQGSSYRD